MHSNEKPEKERCQKWREENAQAIRSSNAYVLRNGLPLQRMSELRSKPTDREAGHALLESLEVRE